MSIREFRKPKIALENFKSSLLANRQEMESIRNTMSDTKYGEIWGVSGTTVLKYMGYVDKYLANGMSRINMDVEATNKLRWKYKDGEIAKMLNCSNASIQKYCGTRRSHGIPYITHFHIVPDIIPTIIPFVNTKKREKEVPRKEILKQDNWVYPVENHYWMDDEVIIAGDAPMPGIKFQKNTIGHPY